MAHPPPGSLYAAARGMYPGLSLMKFSRFNEEKVSSTY